MFKTLLKAFGVVCLSALVASLYFLSPSNVFAGNGDIYLQNYLDLNKNGSYDAGFEPIWLDVTMQIQNSTTLDFNTMYFPFSTTGTERITPSGYDPDGPFNPMPTMNFNTFFNGGETIRATHDYNSLSYFDRCYENNTPQSTQTYDGNQANLTFGQRVRTNCNLYMYVDINGDGTYTSGTDTGVPNITVFLYRNDCAGGTATQIASYTTNGSGQYTVLSTDISNNLLIGEPCFYLNLDQSDPDIPSVIDAGLNGIDYDFGSLNMDMRMIAPTTLRVQSNIASGSILSSIRFLHDDGSLSTGNPYDPAYTSPPFGGIYGNVTANSGSCAAGTYCYQEVINNSEQIKLVSPLPLDVGFTGWTGCTSLEDNFDGAGLAGTDGTNETCVIDFVANGTTRVVTANMTNPPPVGCASPGQYCGVLDLQQGLITTKFVTKTNFDTVSGNTNYSIADFATITDFSLYTDGSLANNGTTNPIAASQDQTVRGNFYLIIANGSGRHFSTAFTVSNFGNGSIVVPICTTTDCSTPKLGVQSVATAASGSGTYSGQGLSGIQELTTKINPTALSALTNAGVSNSINFASFSSDNGRGEYYKPLQLNLTVPAFTPVGNYQGTLTMTTTAL